MTAAVEADTADTAVPLIAAVAFPPISRPPGLLGAEPPSPRCHAPVAEKSAMTRSSLSKLEWMMCLPAAPSSRAIVSVSSVRQTSSAPWAYTSQASAQKGLGTQLQ